MPLPRRRGIVKKPAPWFVLSGLFMAGAVLLLTACTALSSVGDDLESILPATQGDVDAMGQALDGIERGAVQTIEGVASGSFGEAAGGALLAFLSSVSFVIGLSRRRRAAEIQAAKIAKKAEALAPVIAVAAKVAAPPVPFVAPDAPTSV